MAAEREPPPLGDGKPTDFEDLEDGEDLFTSTVSTLEVRARRCGCCAASLSLVSPFPCPDFSLPTPRVCKDRLGVTPVTRAPPPVPVRCLCLGLSARPPQESSLRPGGADLIL